MTPVTKRTPGWPVAVPAVAAAAGLLFAASAFTADGTDLRSTTTDLSTLVSDRADDVADLRAENRQLRSDIADLSDQIDDVEVEQARDEVSRLERPAGMLPVSGPGLIVTLDDAPSEVIDEAEIDANYLVVHQQDIQAFVNALWAAGAEAISLQGQRLISTSGIKCVGNNVVLEGVAYAPPYRIEAVGSADAMQAVLAASQAVQGYNEFVRRYDLGLTIDESSDLDIPGYGGAPRLEWATPAE